MTVTAAQATAEATLQYQATVTRATTGPVSLDDDLNLVHGDDTTIWEGPVGWSPLTARDIALAARTELEASGVIRAPMAATGLRAGDAVTITAAVGDRADPALVDAVFTLGAGSTSAVLRRFLAVRHLNAEGTGA